MKCPICRQCFSPKYIETDLSFSDTECMSIGLKTDSYKDTIPDTHKNLLRRGLTVRQMYLTLGLEEHANKLPEQAKKYPCMILK